MIDILHDSRFRPPGFLETLKEALLGRKRPLACLQVEVTSACTGACAYCPHTTQKGAWRSRQLAPETLAALWPLMRASERVHLQGWGEPLLHPHFLEFQQFCKKAGCATSTTSCGLKMNDELARGLATSGMDIMAFSLVGTDDKSNDARTKVPFETVCQSIAMLRSAIDETGSPLEIHLAYLMLADRMEAAGQLPELMDKLNVEMAVVSTLDYLSVPQHDTLAFAPHEQDKISRARDILAKAAAEAASNGRIIHYALPGAAVKKGGCRENIAQSLYMDAGGNISPCVYLNVPGSDPPERRRVFGNVRELSPTDIWKQEDFRNFRKNLQENNPDEACFHCPKRLEEASE